MKDSTRVRRRWWETSLNPNSQTQTQTPNNEKPKTLIPEEVKQYLRKPDEPDRVFPKNKKVEVVFLVEAVNAILPRTEGADDITIIKLPGTEYEVPIILPEKLQAVARRKMLAQLRNFRDAKPDKLKKYLEKLVRIYSYKSRKSKEKGGGETEVSVNFVKAREIVNTPEKWNCFIQPPGGDVSKATDVGMDGYCPACALFGAALTNNEIELLKEGRNIFDEAVGLKSRVEFDPAITFLDKEKTVASYTHSKVSDGVSWTGMSLYCEQHVLPGTIFVGKVTLEDVTEDELKAFLAVLSAVDRLGGRERIYGGVRVHLVGIRGGRYETVSALEIARHLAKKYGNSNIIPAVEDVRDDVLKYVENKYSFKEIKSEDFLKLLDVNDAWDSLWGDTVEYDRKVVGRILELIRGAGKFSEQQQGDSGNDK